MEVLTKKQKDKEPTTEDSNKEVDAIKRMKELNANAFIWKLMHS